MPCTVLAQPLTSIISTFQLKQAQRDEVAGPWINRWEMARPRCLLPPAVAVPVVSEHRTGPGLLSAGRPGGKHGVGGSRRLRVSPGAGLCKLRTGPLPPTPGLSIFPSRFWHTQGKLERSRDLRGQVFLGADA